MCGRWKSGPTMQPCNRATQATAVAAQAIRWQHSLIDEFLNDAKSVLHQASSFELPAASDHSYLKASMGSSREAFQAG
jgi:hypothetical protein